MHQKSLAERMNVRDCISNELRHIRQASGLTCITKMPPFGGFRFTLRLDMVKLQIKIIHKNAQPREKLGLSERQ